MSTLRDGIGVEDVAGGGRPFAEANSCLEALGGLEAPINGLGMQYRQAFRVRLALPVHLEAPITLDCETVDLSVSGVRFNRELPCAQATVVSFTFYLRGRGVTRPRLLELEAEVVRTQSGDTGLRFVGLSGEQRRAVREIVQQQQAVLIARRAERHSLPRPAISHT